MNNQNYIQQPQQGYGNQPGFGNGQMPYNSLVNNPSNGYISNPQNQQQQQIWQGPYMQNTYKPFYQQGYQQTEVKLPGRVISNPQEIKPNEILMDGSVCIFPMTDYSCIFAKAWGSDGSIHTVKFIPEQPVNPVEPQSNPEFSQIMARLDNIEKIISKKYNYQNKQNIQQQKQEVENNG